MRQVKSLSDWLDGFGLEQKVQGPLMQLGLERIKKIAEALFLLPYPIPTITVAGTNGKGSTVKTLESILIAHGFKVGSFTSPHLFKVNERIKLNGCEISDTALIKQFEVIDNLNLSITPTYFEWLTLAALLYFKEEEVDYVVLEVGLGGRLDAVNIIDPRVSIITSIGLDHQAYLGNTREAIGLEKAGIFRENGLGVYADKNPPKSVLKKAQDLNMSLYCQIRDFEIYEDEKTWDFVSETLSLKGLPKTGLSLLNVSAAIKALTLLPIKLNKETLLSALGTLYLPGRLHFIKGEPNYLLDVAHNRDAIKQLSDYLKSLRGDILCVFSMFKDKEVALAIETLAPYVKKWYVSPLDSDRTLSMDALKSLFESQNINDVLYFESVSVSMDQVSRDANKNDTILVTGSFLTVGMAYNSGYTGWTLRKRLV